MKMKLWTGLLGLFGVFHGLYAFLMFSESLLYGLIWLCIGFVELSLASFVLYLKNSRPKLAAVLLMTVLSVLFVQITLDGVIMASSISFGTSDADKVIVLGYQLKEDTASETLLQRLRTAYEYAKDNKETKLIVTGGITNKNSKSEAEVMKDILISYGIENVRIFEEKEAKNTIDNLRLSKEFISSSDKVVLITSNYHCLRAKVLAKQFGYSVKTIGASAPLKLLLNQLFLEKVSLLQIFLFGV